MLIGGVVGVVVVMVVVAVIVAVVVRSRSHDDEHSVEHYHRQLHTLEEMRAHPSESGNGNGSGESSGNGSGESSGNGESRGNANGVAYPASAFRVTGSSAVRLTEPGRPVVPPVPPPSIADPGQPISFSDDDVEAKSPERGEEGPEKPPGSFMSGTEDRAMHGINHRPRRLARPAAAVAAVLVLVVVLVVTGLHANPPPRRGRSAVTATTSHNQTGARRATTTSTTSTAPPAVSAPQGATAHSASYLVTGSNYALAFSASGGDCWIQVTNVTNGSVLFSATLSPGQSHALTVTGPVTVIAGAPSSFAATVNGAAVTLPPGNQAPFTLQFQATPTPAGSG